MVLSGRPLTSADLTSVPWLDSTGYRVDGWRDEHTRSAVLVDEDVVVAAGIIWTSRVHGDRYWARIDVEPRRRRLGIGSAMLAHLTTLRAVDLPYMTRGFVGDAGLAFADAHGARTIQVVPPSEIDVDNRVMLPASDRAVSAHTVPWEALLAANAATYAWTHAAWSPVADDFASALNEDLAEELDREASSVVLSDGGEIRVIVLAYRDTQPPVITAETVRPDVEDGERIVADAVRRTLDIYAARGVRTVEFDGHVSDPHFHPVWARLAPTGRWFRLVELPAPRPATPAQTGHRARSDRDA